MAIVDSKGGGFGSLPGDLFSDLITYFGGTASLGSSALDTQGHKVLVQLTRTEHAAANAEKSPYVVDVVFKCVSIQANYLIATDTSKPDTVRVAAMTKIETTLTALEQLWV